MARPPKLNAEWFTHMGNLRNDRRVKAIRRATGAAGYGIFHMLLEALTDADYTTLSVDAFELELLAGDFGVSVTEIDSLLQIGKKVGYFLVDEANMLTCPELNKWLEMHFEKRNRSRNRGSGDKLPHPVTETGVSVTVIPHNTLQYTTEQYTTQTPPTPGVGVLAENSKKNEGSAEELPSEGSTASASHTGGGAAAVDMRPEFRPEESWAPQMRELAEQMAIYWQLGQQQQQARMALTRFCRTVFERGEAQLLTDQFEAYRAYKDFSQERKHAWDTFTGKEASAYTDGAWNKQDWVAALAVAHTSATNHGNNSFRHAAPGNGSASNSSLRHNIPARISYENDAA
jgi:hypothetical protein